jgi:hypothetical protein
VGVRAFRGPIAASAALVLAGCWKEIYPSVPTDVIRFQPEYGGPADWVVSRIEVPLRCPDGEPAQFYLLHPEAPPDAPMPAAVLYHSGSFDYVYAPTSDDPLAGTHFADPSRLGADWAVRQVFVTLGMYPEQDATEIHDGRLPVALADAGIAVMLPSDCWGDLWADKSGGADNDFAADFFTREGRAAAEWGYQFLADPLFASAFGVELPVQVDPTQIYALGLGEGGRAVAELLSIDNDGDGNPDYHVAGAMVDSPQDDLRVYYADQGLFASTLEGLSRIYPAGSAATASGSVWHADLPDRFAYLYSVNDPRLPTAVNDAAVARLGAGDWVSAGDGTVHVRSNGGAEPELPEQIVTYLTTGTPPGP